MALPLYLRSSAPQTSRAMGGLLIADEPPEKGGYNYYYYVKEEGEEARGVVIEYTWATGELGNHEQCQISISQGKEVPVSCGGLITGYRQASMQ